MIEVTPVPIDGRYALGISVRLPRTHLVIATTPAGYIMCGALDVALFDRLLPERGVVAGRALGVRNLQDLLGAPLESVTAGAAALGLHPGLPGREALRLLLDSTPGAPADASLPTAADGDHRAVDP